MNVHWSYVFIVCLLFSALVSIIGGLLYTIKFCRLENDFLRSDLEAVLRRAKVLDAKFVEWAGKLQDKSDNG